MTSCNISILGALTKNPNPASAPKAILHQSILHEDLPSDNDLVADCALKRARYNQRPGAVRAGPIPPNSAFLVGYIHRQLEVDLVVVS